MNIVVFLIFLDLKGFSSDHLFNFTLFHKTLLILKQDIFITYSTLF